MESTDVIHEQVSVFLLFEVESFLFSFGYLLTLRYREQNFAINLVDENSVAADHGYAVHVELQVVVGVFHSALPFVFPLIEPLLVFADKDVFGEEEFFAANLRQ